MLVAECPEGLGNRTFEQWMSAAHKPDDLLARIKHEFALGGHKAAAIAAVLKRAQVYLMSALPQEAVRICGMTPIDSLSDGISAALGSAGPEATLLAIPNGGSVLPSVSEE